MELDSSQLYSDKTWVATGLALTLVEKKGLLLEAKEFCDALAIEDLECCIDKLSGGSILRWGGNKALVISAEFDPYEFQGVLTINQFGSACVVSTYKHWLGDSFFAVNHSAEARRRAVVDKLQDVELIDYFFLIDEVIDQVSEFLLSAVKELGSAR